MIVNSYFKIFLFQTSKTFNVRGRERRMHVIKSSELFQVVVSKLFSSQATWKLVSYQLFIALPSLCSCVHVVYRTVLLCTAIDASQHTQFHRLSASFNLFDIVLTAPCVCCIVQFIVVLTGRLSLEIRS